MPAKVKVRIVAGRDLPVMDRSSELTDAFVEVNHRFTLIQKSFHFIPVHVMSFANANTTK